MSLWLSLKQLAFPSPMISALYTFNINTSMGNILYLSSPNEETINQTSFLTCPKSPTRTRTKCSSLKPRGCQLYDPLTSLQVPPLNPDAGIQERLLPTSSLYSNPLFQILLTMESSVFSLISCYASQPFLLPCLWPG